jgi:hypothetical protein
VIRSAPTSVGAHFPIRTSSMSGECRRIVTVNRGIRPETGLTYWPPAPSRRNNFRTHTKADPRNCIPRPTTDTVFQVAVNSKIHRGYKKSGGGKALADHGASPRHRSHPSLATPLDIDAPACALQD